MTCRALLDFDAEAIRFAGYDNAALGPSDSSDSGSDVTGLYRGDLAIDDDLDAFDFDDREPTSGQVDREIDSEDFDVDEVRPVDLKIGRQ